VCLVKLVCKWLVVDTKIKMRGQEKERGGLNFFLSERSLMTLRV